MQKSGCSCKIPWRSSKVAAKPHAGTGQSLLCGCKTPCRNSSCCEMPCRNQKATTKSHATIAQHLGGCKMSCRNRVGAVKCHAEIAVAVKHDAEIEWVRRNAMQKSCSSCKMPCRNQAVAAKCCTEIKQQLQNAMCKPGRWLHNPMQQ